MNNDKCPNCGGPLSHLAWTCNPPIIVDECPSCGYRTEDGRVVNNGTISVNCGEEAIKNRAVKTILFVDEDGGIMYEGNHNSVKEAMIEYVHKNFGNRHFVLTQILCKLDDCDTDLIINVYNKWEPELPIKKVYFCDSAYSVE